MRIVILSKKQLKIIEQHTNNERVRYLTLFLTLLGCISQLYHHTKDYVEKDVLRELSKVSVDKFDLPDQTLCFQFAYLISLPRIRQVKPIILQEVERYFKIRLDEKLYFKLIQTNDSFKEYFLRKLDEHVNYGEFFEILMKKSEIFDRVEVSQNDKMGVLNLNQIHQYCLIKQLVKTFYACYTFTCSMRKLNNESDNNTQILDDIPDYEVKNFEKYIIQQRFLLSYLGKNIVFKIHLKKETFIKNGMKNFQMQLHEANTYPRRLESLIHVQEVRPNGFRQLYTYTFLHVKRLPAPFKSNCTPRTEYRDSRRCAHHMSEEQFNSLLFGVFYSNSKEFHNLSLGLNQQYFYYKYNQKVLERFTTDCDVNTNADQCDEFIYYVFSNLPLPADRMILQLMVPINANYLCEDRPKLELSEYLLKCLSIINFWFGFTIIQMLFDLHDDASTLYRRVVSPNWMARENDQRYLLAKQHDDESNEMQQNNENEHDKLNADDEWSTQKMLKYERYELMRSGDKIDEHKSENNKRSMIGNGLNYLKDKLFKTINKTEKSDRYLLDAYLEDSMLKRAILYRNLQLNNWIYNPLTYSTIKLTNNDLDFLKLNNHYFTCKEDRNLNRSINCPQQNLDKVVYKAIEQKKNNASISLKDIKEDEKRNDEFIKFNEQLANKTVQVRFELENKTGKKMDDTSFKADDDEKLSKLTDNRHSNQADNKRTNEPGNGRNNNHSTVFKTVNFKLPNQSGHQSNNESIIDSPADQVSNRTSKLNKLNNKWKLIKKFVIDNLPTHNRIHDSPI